MTDGNALHGPTLVDYGVQEVAKGDVIIKVNDLTVARAADFDAPFKPVRQKSVLQAAARPRKIDQVSKFVRFESTVWDIIKKARTDGQALKEVIQTYRPAIINFVQRCGFSEHEAEDLAQEVFMRMCREDVLSRVDAKKGKFRTFLLVITKNIIASEVRKKQADKRGGGHQALSLDELKANIDFDVGREDGSGSQEFDREWLNNLTRIALARLQQESREKKTLYFAALSLYLSGHKYDEIASRLGKSLTDVKVLIHYARNKVKTYVKELVMNYSASQQEYEDEMRYLSRFMQ